MSPFFVNRRAETPAARRRQHANYLAQRMAPMIRALLVLAALAYPLATLARSLISTSSIPLSWRLAPVVPLVLIAVLARRTQRPRSLSLLTLGCLLLLEIGINLNGLGRVAGQPWVMPGLLLPVASSVIWPGRWDFVAAMALCALGPLPMLLLGAVDAVSLFQYAVYMAIAIALSAVLRAFMARTLLEQFRLEHQLREQANTDGLTGLLVRNRFLELAHHALDEVRGQPPRTACMLYLDADHFKRLNDNHGHAAGDTALVALAATLRAHSRQDDLIGRIGGEEFALLLPDLDLAQASRRAEQLRLAVRAIKRPDGPLTVSIGVAEYIRDGRDNVETLLARADQALRRAKHSGRDQTVSA